MHARGAVHGTRTRLRCWRGLVLYLVDFIPSPATIIVARCTEYVVPPHNTWHTFPSKSALGQEESAASAPC